MYKNMAKEMERLGEEQSFNPCFNGTMYKNSKRDGKIG